MKTDIMKSRRNVSSTYLPVQTKTDLAMSLAFWEGVETDLSGSPTPHRTSVCSHLDRLWRKGREYDGDYTRSRSQQK